ncbi:hypothetical protein [Actinacidiphila rubida]|uniref:Uncharacterized protein n=1 Tax=Actinacidiphila rubida TaxID=310780 RepID=A0A1H8UHB3_9ACTN|nr:hypothetical protein [Actinacidiphila rubida]SEP02571.1 hypothetical protein SAMN05216267_10738 [Actinacidiphila rubida]
MSGPDWAVPYITKRDGEQGVPESMLSLRYNRAGRPIGIRYTHELARNRDDRDVLWARVSQDLSPRTMRPVGKPLFALMHPARQRETMAALRCQVCHGQPSRNKLGYLFLEMAGHAEVEGIVTAQPPVCLDHAVAGINDCRRLHERGYVLLRSKVPRLHGVIGQVFRAVGHQIEALPPLLHDDGSDYPIPYTRGDLMPYVLASQLVRRLTGVTLVDIDAELEAAGRDRLAIRRGAGTRCPAHRAPSLRACTSRTASGSP